MQYQIHPMDKSRAISQKRKKQKLFYNPEQLFEPLLDIRHIFRVESGAEPILYAMGVNC